MGLSLFLSACDFSWKRQESIEKRGKVMYNRQQCDFFTEEGEEKAALGGIYFCRSGAGDSGGGRIDENA